MSVAAWRALATACGQEYPMTAVPSPVPGALQQSDSHGKLREWAWNRGLAPRQKGPARVCKFQLGFVFVKMTRLGTICPQTA